VKRCIAVCVMVLVLAVLVLAAPGCGSGGDPYTGTWSAPGNGGTFVIAKANDGWYSIDNGPDPDTPHIFYAAELNGELETTNARSTFKRVGDTLQLRMLPDSPVVELTKQ
jgi:hypothetical protein